MLRAADVSWLTGHKLDTTTVLPATGYLAMAIEAACQTAGLNLGEEEEEEEQRRRSGEVSRRLKFGLRHVHVEKALVVPDHKQTGIEVFTTLQPATPLATRGNSKGSSSAAGLGWHRFIISSFAAGEPTRHAQGQVTIVEDNATGSTSNAQAQAALPVDADAMEHGAPRTWYKKFVQEGLNFSGPLQSLIKIETHRRREQMHLWAETALAPGLAGESAYALHPIAINALFQSGPIACTRGVVRDFTAKVPVYIEDMELRLPHSPSSGVAADSSANGSIRTVCTVAGLGAIRVDSQTYEGDEMTLQIKGCRMVPYQSGAAGKGAEEHERHPMLHVAWKPDVDRLADVDNAAAALTAHLAYLQDTTTNGQNGEVAVGGLLGACSILWRTNGLRPMFSWPAPRCQMRASPSRRPPWNTCASSWVLAPPFSVACHCGSGAPMSMGPSSLKTCLLRPTRRPTPLPRPPSMCWSS